MATTCQLLTALVCMWHQHVSFPVTPTCRLDSSAVQHAAAAQQRHVQAGKGKGGFSCPCGARGRCSCLGCAGRAGVPAASGHQPGGTGGGFGGRCHIRPTARCVPRRQLRRQSQPAAAVAAGHPGLITCIKLYGDKVIDASYLSAIFSC